MTAATSRPGPGSSGLPDAPLTVLVVDDSAAGREVARAMLESRGFAVSMAPDGPAALDRLADEPVDLVLLDGMLPGMDGPAVAREVRRREHEAGLPRLPMVALTARALPEDRHLALEAGMDDHLAKPLQASDLDGVLARCLPAGTVRRQVTIPPRRPAPAASESSAPRVSAPRAASGSGDWATSSASAPEVVASSPGIPLVDVEALRQLAELGDLPFLRRIVELFLADADARVAQVEAAADRSDAVALLDGLHALAGICGSVGALALDAEVRRIHGAPAAGAGPAATSGVAVLRPTLEATRVRLLDHLGRMERSAGS